MAKARIGHFVEAQILQALGVDFVDESEVLTPADEEHHINKWDFTVPFVCGCRNLGEALRRIAEGAAMIRTKGEAGTGDVVEAVRHARAVMGAIRSLQTMAPEELFQFRQGDRRALRIGAHDRGNGSIAGGQFRGGRGGHACRCRPDDAIGRRWRVRRLRHFQERQSGPARQRHRQGRHALQGRRILAEVSRNLGEAMVGRTVDSMPEAERIAGRGW